MSTIKDSASERIASLNNLRRTLSGKIRWFDTVVVTQQDLRSAFLADVNMQRRAKVYFVLGLSLGDILDKRGLQCLDFMRALVLVSQELETFSLKEPLPQAPLMTFARKEKTKKSLFSRNGDDFALLNIPHFAFNPEYLQSLSTLLEVIYEVYAKITAHVTSGGSVRDIGPAVIESYNKFNSRIKKLLSAVYKDVDIIARNKVKAELDSLMSSLITY